MIVLVLTWIAFGLLVGLMARAIMPGRQSMGLVPTTLLGVVGAFIGGLIGNLLVGQSVLALHPASFIGSVVGALIVLAIVGMGSRRLAT
ncbi:GlsB/YeaQ/YmgE family stress response membrane protein [Sandaracinus amylolyticus]|uniref:GlsB/YeaQ/YmgE family stress response membrane protein n=1 Tax=Sandaracinus amylolyticus TaxID=927083 RepID=UPI001F465D93|nr:GlsB/YeaQ/YmgE family stress response membrane protein [Sandaracinus amylolyticus]UJR80004.1 Transglycosylase [Sandaracinus amylolyticus]